MQIASNTTCDVAVNVLAFRNWELFFRPGLMLNAYLHSKVLIDHVLCENEQQKDRLSRLNVLLTIGLCRKNTVACCGMSEFQRLNAKGKSLYVY